MPISKLLNRLLADLEEAEKRRDYRAVLTDSLEIVTYLPKILGERAISRDKIIKIVGYLGDFLALLQERDEILNLQIALNLLGDQSELIQEANDILSRAIQDLEHAKGIFKFLEENPAASQEEIVAHISAKPETSARLLTRAVQLNIISEYRGRYSIKEGKLTLKNILS